MSESCEVVRIVRPECPGGFCEINETDLKDTDTLYIQKEVTTGDELHNKKKVKK